MSISNVTRGFEAFRRGTMGNAGQNLYVSRNGILQRIFQFDLDQDGYADLVFCNSQNHWERPPAYLYPDPLADPSHRILLPAEGARSGVRLHPRPEGATGREGLLAPGRRICRRL